MVNNLINFQNLDSSNNLGSCILTFPYLSILAIPHRLSHEIIVSEPFIILHKEATFVEFDILCVDNGFDFFLFFALIVFGLP